MYRPGAPPAPSEADLLLFVAGEPDPRGDSGHVVEKGTMRTLTGAIVGVRWVTPRETPRSASEPAPGATGEGPWALPAPHGQCVRLVEEAARKLARTVAVIDVNRPEGCQELIKRWVKPDGLLPLLVRRDGERLEGIEKFVPRTLRRFIARPAWKYWSPGAALRGS